MRKGVLGLSLEMIIAFVIIAAIIFLIIMTNTSYGSAFMKVMTDTSCKLIGTC